MKSLNIKPLALAVVAGIVTLSGCTTTAINESRDAAIQQAGEVDRIMSQANRMTRSATSVSVVDDMYIAGKAFRLSEKDKLPAFFSTKIAFSQLDPVSFQEVVSNIQVDLNTRIEITDDAIQHINSLGGAEMESSDSEVQSIEEQLDLAGTGFVGSALSFTLKYDGTVAGLLDHVTSKANLYWSWSGNKVRVFRHETKHHIFDGDAGQLSFAAKMSSNSEGAQQAANSSSEKTIGIGQSTSMTLETGNQYTDLVEGIKSMLSTTGRFSVSSQQGIVTITDTPDVQEKIGEYIEQVNAIVNKRVAVKTEIFDIAVEDTANLGIDLAAMYEKVGDFSVGLTPGFSDLSGGGFTLTQLDAGSRFSGSQAFLNALATVGEVASKTQATSYSKNGKTIPLQVGREQGYAASISPVIDDEGNVTGYDMQAGSVLDGYTLSITPKVNSDGDIDIKFAADITDLESIDEITAGESMIQAPKKNMKSFIQDVTIDSGRTMMISGFERTVDSSEVKSLGGESVWALGGSKKGGKTKMITVIMVTPYIMAK